MLLLLHRLIFLVIRSLLVSASWLLRLGVIEVVWGERVLLNRLGAGYFCWFDI